MSGKVFLRIGVIVLAIGLLAWFVMGSTKAREYEQIHERYLYRATVTNVDEFTAAEAKVQPRTVALLIAPDQDKVEPWASVLRYAFRSHIKTDTLAVSPDGTLSFAQIADIITEIESYKHLPILMVGPDGVRSGKVTAAYRLAIDKMPLAEVERLAELPDAPPETTQEIREFARAYDRALRELAQKAPATAPASAPAK